MKAKKWLYWEWLGLFCLILTIISLCITVTINFRPLYLFDIGYLNILDYTDLSQKELLNNYQQLMSYLNNPLVNTLKMMDFPTSKSGAFHFYEVKRLFLLCYGVLLATIIPSGIYLNYLRKTQRLWRLIRPFQWGMVLPVCLGFLMFIGFDQFFVAFHSVFFNNDDWLFNPATDPIINVLPETFFMHCFILFFILLEAMFLTGILLGKKQLKALSSK